MRDRKRFGHVLTLLVVACVAGILAVPAAAQEVPPPPEPGSDSEGVAYLVISLTPTFDWDGETLGTPTIVVPLGLLAGGTSLEDTTFTLEDAIFVPVTSLPMGYSFESLEGNETTIIGTLQTDDDGTTEIHLINSTDTTVDDDVEYAIYHATRYTGEGDWFEDLFRDPNTGEARFPTTNQIVDFISDFLPVETSATSQDIADAIFETDDSLTLPDDTSPTIEAEGDLFPHGDNYYSNCNGGDDDGPEPLFQFAFLLNDQGATDILVCNEIIDVTIDIMPGSTKNPVNLKKKGLLPVALLTTDDFDALDVDPDTVTLGTVYAEKYAVEDVDGDGDDDVIFHFSVPELIAGTFLSVNTASLTLEGELYGDDKDVCVRGSDSVTVPPNGK